LLARQSRGAVGSPSRRGDVLRDGVAPIYAARANAPGLREQAIVLKSTGRNGCGKLIVEAPS